MHRLYKESYLLEIRDENTFLIFKWLSDRSCYERIFEIRNVSNKKLSLKEAFLLLDYLKKFFNKVDNLKDKDI